MTSQVAITLLKNLEQSLDNYCGLNDEGKTAFGMAITALEQFGNSEQLHTTDSLSTVEKEVKPISYIDCANAMLKMWIDGVLTDGEYNRIMDKLNAKQKQKGKSNE